MTDPVDACDNRAKLSRFHSLLFGTEIALANEDHETSLGLGLRLAGFLASEKDPEDEVYSRKILLRVQDNIVSGCRATQSDRDVLEQAQCPAGFQFHMGRPIDLDRVKRSKYLSNIFHPPGTSQNGNSLISLPTGTGKPDNSLPTGTGKLDNSLPTGKGKLDNSLPTGKGKLDNSLPTGTGKLDNSLPTGKGKLDNSLPTGKGKLDNSLPSGTGKLDNSLPTGTGKLDNSLPTGTGKLDNSLPTGTGKLDNSLPTGTGKLDKSGRSRPPSVG